MFENHVSFNSIDDALDEERIMMTLTDFPALYLMTDGDLSFSVSYKVFNLSQLFS